MIINDKTLEGVAAAIKFREMNQEVLSSNVANADTPGYKAKRLDFQEALQSALDTDGQKRLNTTDGKHFNVGGGGFKSLSPAIYEDPNGNVSPDGNNVDRDNEMAQMADNNIQYQAAIQLLNKKLGLLRYAITSER